MLYKLLEAVKDQWCNLGTVTPARLRRGGCKEEAPNRPKMWDNLAAFNVRQAKSRVLVDNLVILRYF